jgi:outer membrane protein with beta-barrel domain
MHSFTRLITVVNLLVVGPVWTCAAQGVGVGGRLSMVRGDVRTDTNAERFTGGHLRAWLSKRTALEVSFDRRVQSNETLTEEVRDYPLQGSLLFAPVPSTFAPYVLGGMGWYTHTVEQLAGKNSIDSTTTRRVGTHAGFGAELRMGRHAAFHADYRYTFLRFGGSDPITADTIAGAVSRSHLSDTGSGVHFLPSYQGSMWTTGLTVYF